MNSVRLRLLILALAPLVLLMPLLLLLGMTRWSTDYDRVLIANVESDLRIAEQYLARIMVGTGDDLKGIAESSEFAAVLTQTTDAQNNYFQWKRNELELDFLYFLPAEAATNGALRWPVIAAGLEGRSATEIDIFRASDLSNLPGDLAARARVGRGRL